MPRPDKQRNINKVASSLIKDPLKSYAEVSKETGVSKRTVCRAKGELASSGVIDKNPRVVKIADTDLEIVDTAQRLMLEKMQDEAKNIKASDLSIIAERSQKRYSFLKGDGSNDDGGDKSLQVLAKLYESISNRSTGIESPEVSEE